MQTGSIDCLGLDAMMITRPQMPFSDLGADTGQLVPRGRETEEKAEAGRGAWLSLPSGTVAISSSMYHCQPVTS